jgi:sugar lactone lactonase YvrE
LEVKRALIALTVLAVAAPTALAEKGKHHHATGPHVIQLPPGFGPEGIATAKKHTFFVGSRLNGAIYRGSLKTGRGAILVPGTDGGGATGMKVDHRGRLFVSGAGTKTITVYDAGTGDVIRRYEVPDPVGFINDVILTKRAAYFTDSNVQQLLVIPLGRHGELGDLHKLPLTGEVTYGAGFNANGIAALDGGHTLIMVKSNTGDLFTADPATGETKFIDLGDGDVANGDGILHRGNKLYVVRNQNNLVAVVRLHRDHTGEIVRTITDPDFNVPTTIARSGGRLYVVNAKFGQDSPTTPYEVVKVPKK